MTNGKDKAAATQWEKKSKLVLLTISIFANKIIIYALRI
jgi:hypothetical protein